MPDNQKIATHFSNDILFIKPSYDYTLKFEKTITAGTFLNYFKGLGINLLL